MTQVRDAALTWHDAGFAVLPTKSDGSKAPAVLSWTGYQATRPTRSQVETWFDNGHPGIGLITGAVSGSLEMLELEGRAVAEGLLPELSEMLNEAGLADLWVQITADGYTERTPSGGLHFLYRVAGDVPGNTKLARRPATDQELADNPREKVKVLAETRGEGGYVVVAPSHGTTHPTGQPWDVAYGQAGAVPTLTLDEREQLHRVFRCLDRMPTPEPVSETRPLQVVRSDGSMSPGDDYETRTDWADILVPLGWRALWTRGGRTYWRRGGKDSPGISATTGGAADGRDRLYVFSTSTEFDTERPYTKFGAYALLEHGGNHSAAAKALRAAGYGKQPPLSPPAPMPAAPPPGAVDGTAARVIAEPAPEPDRFGPTQDGLARALVAHSGDELRYCPQRGMWLHWTGHRWQWDEEEEHRELVRELARALPDTDTWRRFKSSALSAAGVSGVARLAQSDRSIAVAYDKLDANPWILNTPAGIVDLKTGDLRAPDPTALCTRTTLCAPDQTADTARWNEFLTYTFDNDTELIGYLQRLVGYSVIGLVGPHVLPFAFGSGGNGKGVFLEALAGVLGDYATTAPNGFLMAKEYGGHDTEIARLAGARMVICSEVNEDDRFDEAKVKSLTGGDSLTARFMRQDYFTFAPTHQLWLMGNHQPAVRSGGRSFWRRLRLVPFVHEVPEEKVVDDLQGIFMRDHGPALLAWIADGAAAYHSGGLREPASVKAATAEYAHDQDTISKFVEQCCHIGGGEHVTIRIAKLREAYESWCYSEGVKPVSAKRLGMDLGAKFGVIRSRNNSARMYANIALLVDDAKDEPTQRDEQGGW